MEDIYHLECELNDTKLQLHNITRQYEALLIENYKLKESVAEIALENSKLCIDMKKSKRVLSENTKKKWEFYHQSKEELKRQHNISNWRDIKKLSDAMFSNQNLNSA